MFTPFRTVAVLGAGVMGSQIAAHLANAGMKVHLLDLPTSDLGENPQVNSKNALVSAAFQKATKLSPPIFFSDKERYRIQLGNYEEHFHRISEADWVIEAVIENLDIKRQIMARLEGVVKDDAVISSNTSGLPIHEIVAGCTDHFRSHFLGTHFFNPPRYLKLLELIPTAETDAALLARMAWFGREYLGKGVVLAKDTPNFIANRIGLFASLLGIQALDSGYSIEEIDMLTGPLVGRPKSATFRTADLVGLDTLQYVVSNLHRAIPEDERRDTFAVPPLLAKLVKQGALGAKTGQGFYKKVKGKSGRSQILSLNLATQTYELSQPPQIAELADIAQHPHLADRLRSLYGLSGRIGNLFRQMTWDILSYSACRLLEIADSPVDIDQAMRWGFGWEMGPFEIWDALGIQTVLDDLHNQEQPVPSWVDEVASNNHSFYQGKTSESLLTAQTVVGPRGYQSVPIPEKELTVAILRNTPRRTLWKNNESALLYMDDGVVLFEFRSKGNTP